MQRTPAFVSQSVLALHGVPIVAPCDVAADGPTQNDPFVPWSESRAVQLCLGPQSAFVEHDGRQALSTQTWPFTQSESWQVFSHSASLLPGTVTSMPGHADLHAEKPTPTRSANAKPATERVTS
jgi:hypothetical protein